jgi:type IV pilus modification protein PilV
LYRFAGFTLIELLVTVAVLAVLLVTAAPAMRDMILNNRMSSVSNDLMADLAAARSEALRRGQRVVICKNSGTNASCGTGNWREGWLLYLDVDSDTVLDFGETVFRVRQALPTEYSVTSVGIATPRWCAPSAWRRRRIVQDLRSAHRQFRPHHHRRRVRPRERRSCDMPMSPNRAFLHKSPRGRSGGVTLIEILVAILILSFGLLGSAGLQMAGLRAALSANQRTTATLLAYDAADRMRANMVAVNGSYYHNYTATQTTNCMQTVGCSPSQMAQHDMYEWGQAIAAPAAVGNRHRVPRFEPGRRHQQLEPARRGLRRPRQHLRHQDLVARGPLEQSERRAEALRDFLPPMSARSSLQAGFTMIEMLIAMTLGLLLVIVIGQVFVTSKESYRTTEDLSRLQETRALQPRR